MRPIRTEEGALDTDQLRGFRRIVLPERGHPHVAAKDVARRFGEPSCALRRGEVELLQQIAHPSGSVLDDRETQSWMTIENLVTDRGGHRLGGGPVLRDDPL